MVWNGAYSTKMVSSAACCYRIETNTVDTLIYPWNISIWICCCSRNSGQSFTFSRFATLKSNILARECSKDVTSKEPSQCLLVINGWIEELVIGHYRDCFSHNNVETFVLRDCAILQQKKLFYFYLWVSRLRGKTQKKTCVILDCRKCSDHLCSFHQRILLDSSTPTPQLPLERWGRCCCVSATIDSEIIH